MTGHLLVSAMVLIHMSLTGVRSLPRHPGSIYPNGYAMGAATEMTPLGDRRRTETPGRLWAGDEGEEEEEGVSGKYEEEKEEGSWQREPLVFGEQKRFFRPSEEERREKFAELRERNSRDQERRRQQRQLRKSQKERKTRANADHNQQSANR